MLKYIYIFYKKKLAWIAPYNIWKYHKVKPQAKVIFLQIRQIYLLKHLLVQNYLKQKQTSFLSCLARLFIKFSGPIQGPE